MLPWRFRKLVSDRFPLAYHVLANLGDRNNSQEFWDSWLEQTWDEPRRMWPAKNRLIASLTAADDKIVDLGCGSGGILRNLQQAGYTDLHGVELSRYAVDRLAAAGINMHWGKFPTLPLPDAAFDVAIASQVLEHVIRRKKFLSEIARILKPNARAFFFVPDDRLGPIDEKGHVIKFNRDTLGRLLGQFFAIERLESIRDDNHKVPILFALVRKR